MDFLFQLGSLDLSCSGAAFRGQRFAFVLSVQQSHKQLVIYVVIFIMVGRYCMQPVKLVFIVCNLVVVISLDLSFIMCPVSTKTSKLNWVEESMHLDFYSLYSTDLYSSLYIFLMVLFYITA